jgi:F0F1-type ATP synthase assembly protein I
MSEDRDPEGRYGSLRTFGMVGSIGLTLAISVGVGVGLGLLADRHFHTRGLLVIVGLFVGIAAGFKQMLQTLKQATAEDERAGRDGE